ncbi:DUF4296 domain-containing protein [Phocaeicola sp.]|uniref:DUF4296 domain-containing protein n=1 Tax=Phocaeicola sp. TaxID=2773926 RepID=UPI0023C09F27|nr:DUF4296 domain-containing protein [Phocaeicola sp.]MDE5677545.1 DUF4296 domain-containing protein [Phocaeicola sp.]
MCCRNRTWTWLLGAVFVAGCGKQIPKDIIQPNRMEEILYDYHLSISMGYNLSYSDNYQKEAYKNYIFDKHHVTEAQFDSSMVWYTRHTEELTELYKKIGKRFRSEKTRMQELLALRENRSSTSLPGDTVDVWYDRKLYWLTHVPLADKVVFEISADSNFKAKDAFLWSADYIFLSEGDRKATMGFNILFENDSVVGRVEEVTRSGMQTLYIRPDSAFAIRSIHGFIYYTDSDPAVNKPGLIINNITLTRYHEPADTVRVDAEDSLAMERNVDAMQMEKKADTLDASSIRPSSVRQQD